MQYFEGQKWKKKRSKGWFERNVVCPDWATCARVAKSEGATWPLPPQFIATSPFSLSLLYLLLLPHPSLGRNPRQTSKPGKRKKKEKRKTLSASARSPTTIITAITLVLLLLFFFFSAPRYRLAEPPLRALRAEETQRRRAPDVATATSHSSLPSLAFARHRPLSHRARVDRATHHRCELAVTAAEEVDAGNKQSSDEDTEFVRISVRTS